MKKIILLFIFVLLLGGFDNRNYHWEFNYSYEEVVQIKIVEVDLSDYIEIKEIDLSLAEEIYNDVTKIEIKKYGLSLAYPSGECILIVFENGDYDIISQTASTHFKYQNRELLEDISWLYFDENEFNELINKYINM